MTRATSRGKGLFGLCTALTVHHLRRSEQELMQKPWRSAAYHGLTPHCLISMLSYRKPGMLLPPAHNVLDPVTSITHFKNIQHACLQPNLMKAFFSQASLLSDDYSLCQINRHRHYSITYTSEHLILPCKCFQNGPFCLFLSIKLHMF